MGTKANEAIQVTKAYLSKYTNFDSLMMTEQLHIIGSLYDIANSAMSDLSEALDKSRADLNTEMKNKVYGGESNG